MAEDSAAAAIAAAAAGAVLDECGDSHAGVVSQTAQTARARAERAARNDMRKAERARQVQEAEASLLQAQQRAAAEDAADDEADASADGGGSEDSRVDYDVHAILAQARAEAAAASVRIAQLEQRLLTSAHAPSQQHQEQPQQPRPQQQQQQLQAVPGGVHMQVKIDAVQVILLEHATASQQLPNWLFSMEKLQRQIAAASQQVLPWARVFQLAEQHWDYDMNLWWTDREHSARSGNGVRVSSWSGLVSALKADFAPGIQQERAIYEMDGARQLPSDTVAGYLGRMAALYAQVRPERVPSHVFAEKVLRGLDSARYPFGHASVAAQQTARIAAQGSGFPFEVLRTMISTATMPEEQKHALHKQQTQREAGTTTAPAGDRRSRGAKKHVSAVRAAAAADSEDRSDSDDEYTQGSARHSERAEMRAQINALTRALAAASAGGESKAKPRSAGPANASPGEGNSDRARSRSRGDGRAGGQTRGGRCTKCGVKGHGRVDCKSSKEVGCFGCGGDHLRRDCPGEEAEGQSASGNERARRGLRLRLPEVQTACSHPR